MRNSYSTSDSSNQPKIAANYTGQIATINDPYQNNAKNPSPKRDSSSFNNQANPEGPGRSPSKSSRNDFNTPVNHFTGACNLQRICLYSYKSMFLLTTQGNNQLWIDRNTGRPVEVVEQKVPSGYYTLKGYSSFLGIINILDKYFLLMVNDVFTTCKMKEKAIYTPSSVSFIPFEGEESDTNQDPSLVSYLLYFKKLISKGYYFSPEYDLTTARMKVLKEAPVDHQFQWNYALYKDLIKFNISEIWMDKLIQGYVGNFNCVVGSEMAQYFLISRRSTLNSAIRYFARGLDDNGNVANFVESEQIVFFGDRCISYLQIRGSSPCFWKQQGTDTIVEIDRGFELTHHVFERHIDYLKSTYGELTVISLLTKFKRNEKTLFDALERHFTSLPVEKITYERFDIQESIKHDKFEDINVLVSLMKKSTENYSFCVENLAEGTIELGQLGIIRTFDMDCLEWTNLVQSRLAMSALDVALKCLGVKLSEILGRDPCEELNNPKSNSTFEFLTNFRTIWVENGDALSLHYTGTTSLITDVNKIAKKTLFTYFEEGIKVLNRMYNGRYEDRIKQECFDHLLGKYPSSGNYWHEAFEAEIREYQKEYTTTSRVGTFVATWNFAGKEPTDELDISDLFDFQGNPEPELVIIGFQEYIPLKAGAVITGLGKTKLIPIWIDVITHALSAYDKYVLVTIRDLVGLLILVFVKESFSKRIVSIDTDRVMTGLKGHAGNKGATIAKLQIDDTSMVFINCHLDAGGPKSLPDRIKSLNAIYEQGFQREGVGLRKQEHLSENDYQFLFGDLNFRLNLDNEARTMIKTYERYRANHEDEEADEQLERIKKYDELLTISGNNSILKNYREGFLHFLPTYKYDFLSDQYDTSNKDRVPSWTDRILWSAYSEQAVEQAFYDRIENKLSDHRPVVSYFYLQVKKIDEKKKEEISKRIYNVQNIGAPAGTRVETKVVKRDEQVNAEVPQVQHVQATEELIIDLKKDEVIHEHKPEVVPGHKEENKEEKSNQKAESDKANNGGVERKLIEI